MGEVRFQRLSDVFMLNENGEPEQVLNIKNIEEQTTSADELDPSMFPIRFNDRSEFSFSVRYTRRDIINIVRLAWGWRCKAPIRKHNLLKARELLVEGYGRKCRDLCNR